MSEPSLQPNREEQIRQVRAYIEQYRAQYDLTALRQHLLDAGYAHTVVDEALRQLDSGNPDTDGRALRLFGCGMAIANYVVISLIGGMVGSLFNSGYAVLVAPVLVLGTELMAATIMWNRPGRERASRILFWAAIWTVVGSVIVVALVALLVGVCLALFSGQL
ncbi:MAG: hypothetical protein HGB28_00430 [Oscillochloris sp.]|nr:hypothetical protein [Oscillochloris sp.]